MVAGTTALRLRADTRISTWPHAADEVPWIVHLTVMIDPERWAEVMLGVAILQAPEAAAPTCDGTAASASAAAARGTRRRYIIPIVGSHASALNANRGDDHGQELTQQRPADPRCLKVVRAKSISNGVPLRNPVLLVAAVVAIAAVAFVARSHGTSPAAPLPGYWVANGTIETTHGVELELDRPGARRLRHWIIRRVCGSTGCGLTITRSTTDIDQSAPLFWRDHHWRATFGWSRQQCRTSSTGAPLYWDSMMYYVFTVSPDGHNMTASETAHAGSPECGYGGRTVRWTATLNPPGLRPA